MVIRRFVYMVLFVFMISLVSAVSSIEISVDDNLGIGKTLAFNYSILSNVNEDIDIAPSIICDNLPSAMLESLSVSLTAGQKYSSRYVYGVIPEDAVSANCVAHVTIMNPYQYDATEEFSLNLLNSFDFELKICGDEQCAESKNVFIKGEGVYVQYSSGISGISAIAEISYPGGTKDVVNAPASFVADRIGTYKIKLTAEKQGYKMEERTAEIGVIEGQANIQYTEIQDAPSEGIGTLELTTMVRVILISVLVIIVLLIIVLVNILRKKR